MKRLTLFLTVLIIGVFATALPQPAAAHENWPPLLNCSDVDADGHVDIVDIGWIVLKFGSVYPSDDYLLVYDVSGGGNIDVEDVRTVAAEFGSHCPLIETQVAAAALAVAKYRDPLMAVADGYVQWSQVIPAMGMHLVNQSRITDFQPQMTAPAGLLYTADKEFVGVYYLVPTPELCSHLAIPGVCSDLEPIGFGVADDEDNTDANSTQTAWHTHSGLCSLDTGTPDANLIANVPETNCAETGGFWHERYGWMVHLYTEIPNPAGRFLSWNANAIAALLRSVGS